MKIKSILVVFLGTLMSGSVLAGLTQPAEVTIDTENRLATGDMNTARRSDNEFAFIGCGVRVISVSETEVINFGFCQAGIGEAEEERITCFTQNAQLLDGIKSIADYSYVTFSWDENGDCTRIGNSTQSFYLPKVKVKKK
ncbi:hypothetical protein FLL45_02285 [Aliikangiella marina]|uniref:Uncharacterized protein n=1 Tax=Aliikangiella marina TaxID=1712262 RepID=A0A545THY2_9GAMM|nr:hypothetical protein [Aliikangiella marina]TQV76806.1 hypothetical protein FLL45_02285 [Aliikangiella marina]